ncbi:unnamed protein product, partial [Prorocentrum cordatum]
GWSLPRADTCAELARRADALVPAEVRAQVRMDAPRTFQALPPGCQPSLPRHEAEARVCRVLLAFEWRNSNAQVRGLGATYTQGMNYIAGMCLGLCGWSEELGFLLFARLVEDVLGLEYFCEWPPLLGYHTDVAVLPDLARVACPWLHTALGSKLFEEVIAMLAVRLLVPCFVLTGALEESNLLRLWAELLVGGRSESAGFLAALSCSAPAEGVRTPPRLPLITWFVGVVGALGPEAASAAERLEAEERGMAAVSCILQGLATLPPGWHPGPLPRPPASVAEDLVRVRRCLVAQGSHALAIRSLGLPSADVERWQRQFEALPQVGHGEGIDAATLRDVLQVYTPARADYAHELFLLLDRDASDSLDFFELMAGILVLSRCPTARKLDLLFHLYDTDGSGALEVDELQCLAATLARLALPAEGLREVSHDEVGPYADSPLSGAARAAPGQARRERALKTASELEECARIRRRLLALDADGDGKLSLEEWRKGAQSLPWLLHLLRRAGVVDCQGGCADDLAYFNLGPEKYRECGLMQQACALQ